MTRIQLRVALAALLCGTGIATTNASQTDQPQALTPPTLALADSVIATFHDSDTHLCGTQKVHIDSPVRAFEDQNHVIHLTVSDPQARGWQWTGSVAGFTAEPKTATLDCTPVMIGNAADNDPAHFNQKTWIQALYFSASTIYAYGHEDYFATRLSLPECHKSGTQDGLPYCWYASIPVWTASTAGTGRHLDFSPIAAAPNHVAIYPHVPYPDHANTPTAGWIGYGTPSNIFRGRHQDGSLDGYWYMFVYTSSGYGEQPKGVCLFRSNDPTDRLSWRAWNGDESNPAFVQVMGNPYTTSNSPCAVVEPTIFSSSLRSVTWHKPSRHYIAVIRDASGVKYTTSTDLLSWSTPQILLVSTSAQANYPTVIDFDGGDYGDDNFDRIYSNGKTYLFYRKSIASGHTRITRRLITVTNYPADPPGPGNPG